MSDAARLKISRAPAKYGKLFAVMMRCGKAYS